MKPKNRRWVPHHSKDWSFKILHFGKSTCVNDVKRWCSITKTISFEWIFNDFHGALFQFHNISKRNILSRKSYVLFLFHKVRCYFCACICSDACCLLDRKWNKYIETIINLIIIWNSNGYWYFGWSKLWSKNEKDEKKPCDTKTSFIKHRWDSVRRAISSFIFFFWFISLVLSCTHTFMHWDPVERLYHFDFDLSNIYSPWSWFQNSQYGYYSCSTFFVAPRSFGLLPFSISFNSNMSFNSNRPQVQCVNKSQTICQKVQKPYTRKKNVKHSNVFRFILPSHECMSVFENVFVWVDLDNSNKLNGMQSL